MKSILNTSGFLFFNLHKKELLERLTLLKSSNKVLSNCNPEILKNIDAEYYYNLIEIEVNLEGLRKKFEKIYASKNFPLSAYEQKYCDKLNHTYIELIDNLFICTFINKLHSPEQKTLEGLIVITFCRALEVLNIIFLIALESKNISLEGLWKLAYRLYQISESLDLLNFKIIIDNRESSIALLFKQIIIFHSLRIENLTLANKRIIFRSLLRVINSIEIKIADELDYGTVAFAFDFSYDAAPFRIEYSNDDSHRSLRYIKIADIMQLIQQLLQQASANNQLFLDNYELFFPLFIALEQQKKHQRNYTRIQSKYGCQVLLGFNNLIDFLFEQEKNIIASQQTEEFDKFLGVAQEEMNRLQTILNWSPEKECYLNYSCIDKTHIVDSTIIGYAILWDKNIHHQPQIGDIIGVLPSFYQRSKVEIGLIRRMTPTENGILLGIEIIGLNSTLIHIEQYDKFDAEEWVIFLYGSPNYDMSILCDSSSHHQRDDLISIILENKSIMCQLGDVLNSSNFIKQISLKI